METNAQNAKGSPPREADSAPRVTYAPHLDATPEGELAALASVYRFVLDRHEAKKAAGTDEDKTGPQGEDGRRPRYVPPTEGEDGEANLGANDG